MTSGKWNAFSHFFQKKKKERERESSLMQDTKLFWFTQVLGKNLHGRTIKGVGDNPQPSSKAESSQPRAKNKDSSALCRHLVEYSLPVFHFGTKYRLPWWLRW